MPTRRIPIATSIDPENTNASLDLGTSSLNIVYDTFVDGTVYATQRAAATIFAEASKFSQGAAGRGVYYWEAASSFYVVNNGQVSAGYGLSIGNISPGKNRVYFTEVGNYLLLIDPENNEGWYLNKNAPTALNKITDPDFPSNQSPNLQLAAGAVTLDGFCFVLDTNGTVWQSQLGNPSSWNALDFITAEREADQGVFIAKHHDSIVVLGTRTVEFFYNAGNASGSVLARRQDVSYRTGSLAGNAFYAAGDQLYFLGLAQGGTVGLYQIDSFRLIKKSTISIDKSLAYNSADGGESYILAAAMVDDHPLVYLTTCQEETAGRWSATGTWVFDGKTNLWSAYQFAAKDLGGFPIIDLTDKTVASSRAVTLLSVNGDLLEFASKMEPIDTIGQGNYFLSPNYLLTQSDYINESSETITGEIELEVTLPWYDNDTYTNSFAHSLWVLGGRVADTEGTEPILVSWSDGHDRDYTTPREISTDMVRKLTRLGKYKKRTYKLYYQGPEALRLEGLEVTYRGAEYA